MATELQNFTAALNALVDGTATVAQRTAVADTAVYNMADEEIAAQFPGATRQTLTNEQRAKIANDWIKLYLRIEYRRMKIKMARDAAGTAASAEADPL